MIPWFFELGRGWSLKLFWSHTVKISKIFQVLKSFAFIVHHVIVKLGWGSRSVRFVFINFRNEGAFSFENSGTLLIVMALKKSHTSCFIFLILVKSFK